MTSKSRADELVKNFPPNNANYDKVIISLKNRFGLEKILIEVYVRELLQLVLQNAITPAKDIRRRNAKLVKNIHGRERV